MKRNGKQFPKKFFPKDAQRITNTQGIRVWLIAGKEYVSRADYLNQIKADTGTAVEPQA
jgi:hypothetical protein